MRQNLFNYLLYAVHIFITYFLLSVLSSCVSVVYTYAYFTFHISVTILMNNYYNKNIWQKL